MPSVMKTCLICSKDNVEYSWSWRHFFPSSSFSYSKPNLCRLWTMYKNLLLLLIYIIPLNIFLSCSRGVKGTLVKERDSFPEELSAQKANCNQQCREKKNPSQREKERAALGNCQLKSTQKGKLVCRSPEWQVQCPLGQNRKVTSQCVQQAL